MGPCYLDYNATTPIGPDVAKTMEPYLHGHFGNPSSSHPYGLAARRAVEKARFQTAGLLGCAPGEIVFTSGGTESNNLAIKGIASAARRRGNHIITSAVEHPAVSEVCRWLEGEGYRITWLPVDGQGLVDPGDLEKAITPETTLVTIMLANNEVGTIEPIADLANLTHARGALLHTDAAQAVGKIPTDVNALGVDLLSLAGHKLYAPKGVGALFIRDGVRPDNQLHGAAHEGGRRPGTENVLEIVGLGQACETASGNLAKTMSHCATMRDRLHEGFKRALGRENIRLNGHPAKRLPNTLSLCFRGVEADALVAAISDEVAVSAGAACHAEGVSTSTVLEAMKVPVEWAKGTIRFSTGHDTNDGEIDRAVAAVAGAVQRLRQ